MTKKTAYRQCRLQRGNLTTVSFIPDKFAKEGWILELRDRHGVWTDGWHVIGAGSLRSGQFVENQAHNSGNIWEPSAVITTRGNK